LDYTLPKLTL